MPLKTWNGSSWVSATALKVWNGSSWVAATNGKVWNGSSWVSFFNPVLDTFTLTAKQGSMTPTKGSPTALYGYMSDNYEVIAGTATIPGSSLSDTTFDVTGSRIDALYFDVGAFGTGYVAFAIDGEYPNSGWTTLSIYHTFSGTTTDFTRSSMNFSSYSTQTTWDFSTNTNPFSNVTTGQNSYVITIS